jgi:hypothetical protein
MISPEHTRIIVEAELEGAQGWAKRHGFKLEWNSPDLRLQLTLPQQETGATYYLRGTLSEYRALPPEWSFTDSAWTAVGRPVDFPRAVQTCFGASIFITFQDRAVICAPFNRLAYTSHSGPHGDWGGVGNWLNAGPGRIHAETIGDMLQAVYRDFTVTRGRMG